MVELPADLLGVHDLVADREVHPWDDCLGELIDTGEGWIIVVLDHAERLPAGPAVFAKFAYQLQRTSDQVAAEANGRFLLGFVFTGTWPTV